MVIMTWSASNIQWGGDHWKTIIISDGKGYYAYLPATFIYQDLNLGFYDQAEDKYHNANTKSDYRTSCNGKTISKYFAGTSLAMLPFFGIGHGITKITGGEADGYSKYYAVLINIAALFWLCIGLIFTRKLLLTYNIGEKLISFLLIALAFGTNLFYYTVREPAMSHVYSFAFVTLFVYHARLFLLHRNTRSLYWSALLLGLIVLIRPVNGLVVLSIPFLAGDRQTLMLAINTLREKISSVIISLLLFLSVCFLQLLLYKISTGVFFADAYNREGFNWSEPHILDFLFSFKKGFLLYTPFFILCMAGWFLLFRDNRFLFWTFGAFLLIVLYVLSCWWQWWYGGSFGSRVMIDYYPLLVIPVAFLFGSLKQQKLKRAAIAFSLFTFFLCQVQTWQYRYYHIHWGNMDAEHYARAFLRIDLLLKAENPNSDLLEQKP